MSVSSIKRHNHRVHTCEKTRKQELLQHLISLYAGKSILVISDANTTTTEIEDKNLTLSNDAELSKLSKRQWDVLISFDLPKISEDYLARLAHTKEIALILNDEKEETRLYPIETLVGKNLPREIIPGFGPKAPAVKSEVKKSVPHRPTASQKRSEKESKPKFIKDSKEDMKEKKSLGKKEWDKPKGDKKPYEKKSLDKRDGDKKPYEKKSWDKPQGDKKPWEKKESDKKPFEKKAWDKPQGEKKPWESRSGSNDYRNKKETTTHTSSQPKRVPRVIKIPSENKTKES